ncbi:triphosphoribosyl-dephospho-CoA synthase CitG [Buttiauxella brennerae]|uniref:triphosphoribosyl-dephospho-CoA synthase CitG n=1 Tax=Buttiauxella brennerae TaxID=82988 RepID=UPI0035BC90B5
MMQTTLARVEVPETIAAHYSELAFRALLAEVNLTPKPGLVDRRNCGAHKDMALKDFYRSADAIHPWLPRFIQQGARTALLPASDVLKDLRPIGMACESAMFRATAGVNTHKGSIFSLGLLCAAIGRLHQQQREVTPLAVCQTVATFCHGLTQRELRQNNHQQTAGQRLFCEVGLTGARGEAEAGYPLVINLALPHYRSRQALGSDPELALLDTLLLLMAHNGDTNIASRGGVEALNWLQDYARNMLQNGGIHQPADLHYLHVFDNACIERNLSPGGSADLLIITWFLAQISQSHP